MLGGAFQCQTSWSSLLLCSPLVRSPVHSLCCWRFSPVTDVRLPHPQAADVYAVGVLLWELLNGSGAWSGMNQVCSVF